MRTLTTHDAKTHLSRYLTAVENGEEFIIARGKRAIARLIPMAPTKRPKVGKVIDKTFCIPDTAFAPLTKEELQDWGL